MNAADLRAQAKALTDAVAAFTEAVCTFSEQAQVDKQREFGAVTVRQAAELLNMGESTIRTMARDGRLEYVNERIPLKSISEHLARGKRRKKPQLRAVGR